MSKDERKVPELRFKGFHDDWEQREIGEISCILTGGTPRTNEQSFWNPKEIPWMSSGEINKKRLLETDDMISEKGLENSSARWVQKNSVLIALAGQGKTRGTVAINTLPLTTNQSIAAIQPSDILDSEYLYQNLDGRYHELRIKSSGDGTRGGLNKKIISELSIDIPKLYEQVQIGKFLKSLDIIITLHQRKINTLENLRKAYSYVMFSNNNNTPLVRFRGFHEKWDSKKLSHYLTTSKEKNLNGAYDKMDVLSVSGVHGVVNQIKFQGRSFAGKTVLNYGVLYNGDIVYTKSPLKVAPHGIIKANKGSNGIVSTLYAIYKTKETAHPSFVQTYFENDLRLNKYLKPLVNKGAKNDMKVTDENVLNGLVSFPILEEQMKIALFDEEIENMIEVNQIKINTMKKLKDIYFRKIFL